MDDRTVARHRLAVIVPRAAPAVATTAVLVLARIWNANGAEHSVGNAALMALLSLAAAAAGVCTSLGRYGDPALAGTAFAASGALALTGVCAYADGLSLPLLLWALVTAAAYGLAARYWREDRRTLVAYQRQASERRERHAHVERVEALRADTQIEVARTGAAYAEQLAAALLTRATLPGFDPAALRGFDPAALRSTGPPALPATEEGDTRTRQHGDGPRPH
ncbi:hypothetical protein ACFVW2_11245 [Streptomyces sp. NPDC058171]